MKGRQTYDTEIKREKKRIFSFPGKKERVNLIHKVVLIGPAGILQLVS